MSDIQTNIRKTLALLESVESGRGSHLLEGGVKQISSDLEDLSDSEFLKIYKKTKAEVRKEFSSEKKKESVKEGISNSDQDPNLAKAYHMGVEAYKAYKDNPKQAQRVQDKIEAEFPQYLKMWTLGYRDGERFDKQSMSEGSEDNYYHDADRLAEGALDAAARYIQDELGIESGDNAGMFFQGEAYDTIMKILSEYAQSEMENQRNSDTENVDPNL